MSRKGSAMSPEMVEILQRLSRLSDAVQKIEHIYLNTEFLRKRAGTYIGGNTAITYLEDETPIYVNSNDFGPPANFINGGIYEKENLDVLMSFVRDDTVFLDIGANLGFYSLKVAQRNKLHGKIHAFEPHPTLVRLARASSYLNGFSQLAADDGVIVVHQCALGDTNGEVTLAYPDGHLGGGGMAAAAAGTTAVVTPVHRLDDFLGPDFTFDLAKIDVEGFELEVLRGMQGLIARSPKAVLLFEKLERDRGYEADIEAVLRGAGLHLFGITADSLLFPIADGELSAYSGYVVASHDPDIERNRNHFRIYPRQFLASAERIKERTRDMLVVGGEAGDIIFHGPYWYLHRGIYRLTLEGTTDGIIEVVLAHHFGYPTTSVLLGPDNLTADVLIETDLPQFELVCRPKNNRATVSLKSIRIQRLG